MSRKIENIHDLTRLVTEALEDLVDDKRGPAYVNAISHGAGTVLRSYALLLKYQGTTGSARISELEAKR